MRSLTQLFYYAIKLKDNKITVALLFVVFIRSACTVVPVHVLKARRGVAVFLCLWLTPALDGCEFSPSIPACFTAGKEPPIYTE